MALILGLSGPAGERVSMRNSARGCMTTPTFHFDCPNPGSVPLVALRHLTTDLRGEYVHVMVALPDSRQSAEFA